MSTTAAKDVSANILRQLHLLIHPGQVTELRALHASIPGSRRPCTVSGYFDSDNLDTMAKAAAGLSGKATGVYFTLNPVNPSLLARSANRVNRFVESGALTTDKNIVRRRWLLIDADPVRESGISATDEEKRQAMATARRVRDYLHQELNWPDPLFADSGNGAHLVYRIDLPTDDGGVVQRCLKAIAQIHDSDTVKIDQQVFNAARICKLYGSLSCKGDNIPDRPHRVAAVLEPDPPADLVTVMKEQLEELAATAPADEKTKHTTGGTNGAYKGSTIQWMENFILKNGIVTRPPSDVPGGRKWVLETCPFDPAHGKDAALFATHALIFKCFHDGCSGKDWKAYRELIEPEAGRRKARPGAQARDGDEQAKDQTPPPGNEYRFEPIDSKSFNAADYSPTWLVKDLVVANQPCVIGGPKKALKTSALIDLTLSLGSGTHHWGHFRTYQQVRTVLISGESGRHTIQETARRICRAKGIDMNATDCLWDFRLPQLSSIKELDELRRGLEKHRVKAAALDPLYLALLAGGDGIQASNMYEMGPLLNRVAQACLSVGCTPFLAHHFRTTRPNCFDPPQLEDLAFAGIQEFARQWLLLGRREAYVLGSGSHRLWFGAGGSIGHGGQWAIDVEEGVLQEDFSGRKWDVQVMLASEIRDRQAEERTSKASQRREDKERDQENRLLSAVDSLASRDGIAIYSRVKACAGLGTDQMVATVFRLCRDGIIEERKTMAIVGHGGEKKTRELRRTSDK